MPMWFSKDWPGSSPVPAALAPVQFPVRRRVARECLPTGRLRFRSNVPTLPGTSGVLRTRSPILRNTVAQTGVGESCLRVVRAAAYRRRGPTPPAAGSEGAFPASRQQSPAAESSAIRSLAEGQLRRVPSARPMPHPARLCREPPRKPSACGSQVASGRFRLLSLRGLP